jgi:hypothetical protein
VVQRALAILIFLLGVVGPSPAPGQTAGAGTAESLVVGETFTLESVVLGEQRRINVYAPAAYDATEDGRFPVLYMPDGGVHEDFLHVAGLVQISSLNGTMRPFLLVGIENTERRRDLTGPTTVPEDRDIAPHVGGSARFRAFIRDELMPVVDARYRTSGETAIVGESLAGLFVVETLLTEPELFDTYVAIDPSLWWDGGRLVDTAVQRLGDRVVERKSLFLAASSQTGIVEPTARLARLLSGDAARVDVTYAPFPLETHLTIYHPAALEAFRRVLAGPGGS